MWEGVMHLLYPASCSPPKWIRKIEPLPLINVNGDHYKEYGELYPSEVDRPSLKPSASSEAKEADKENCLLPKYEA